jgi:membrane protease YdiL (CAAX protease family)
MFQDLQLIFSLGGAYFLIYPLLLYYIKKVYKQDLIEFGYKTKNLAKDIGAGIAGSIFVSLLLILVNLQNPIPKLNLSGVFLDIYFFLLVILGPFCEEIIFRGIIYNFAVEKLNKTAGVIISALIFTLAHMPKASFEMVLFFLLSLILGVLRRISSNLLPSTIAHSIANIAVYFIV